MMKYTLILIGAATVFLLTGCSTVDTIEEKGNRKELTNPWSEKDSFSQTANVQGTSQLPLDKITPINQDAKVSIPVRNMLKKNDPGSAKKLLGKKVDRKALCNILETVTLHHMKSPLSEKHVKAGIEISAMRGRNAAHNFKEPAITTINKARKDTDKPANKVILLYDERYKLRQNVLQWLEQCKLEPKDIYWIPLLTYLELELLGIEQEYNKIVSAGNK